MLPLTLLIMQRGVYDPVTTEFRVPVLIPAKPPNKAEGFTTFIRELGPATPVRVFKVSELKNAHQHFTPEEAEHFDAVIALTTALQNSDQIALRKAEERLKKAYETKGNEPTDLYRLIDGQFGNDVIKSTNLLPREALDVVLGRRPSSRAAKDACWLLSEDVSEMLSASSRLVLWWTGERFTPAIWCDDLKAAIYVRAMLSVVGGKGIRICPHCSEIFFQRRPDQNYCSVAHREAHRVARWRAMKLMKSKTKGGKRGTGKTR